MVAISGNADDRSLVGPLEKGPAHYVDEEAEAGPDYSTGLPYMFKSRTKV